MHAAGPRSSFANFPLPGDPVLRLVLLALLISCFPAQSSNSTWLGPGRKLTQSLQRGQILVLSFRIEPPPSTQSPFTGTMLHLAGKNAPMGLQALAAKPRCTQDSRLYFRHISNLLCDSFWLAEPPEGWHFAPLRQILLRHFADITLSASGYWPVIVSTKECFVHSDHNFHKVSSDSPPVTRLRPSSENASEQTGVR